MSATARLVVQMTPGEKSALAQKARKAGVSAAEYVRRSIKASPLSADDHRDEIEALLTAIETTAPAILKSLQATIDVTDAVAARLGRSDEPNPA